VSGYAVPRHPYFTLTAANVPRASSKNCCRCAGACKPLLLTPLNRCWCCCLCLCQCGTAGWRNSGPQGRRPGASSGSGDVQHHYDTPRAPARPAKGNAHRQLVGAVAGKGGRPPQVKRRKGCQFLIAWPLTPTWWWCCCQRTAHLLRWFSSRAVANPRVTPQRGAAAAMLPLPASETAAAAAAAVAAVSASAGLLAAAVYTEPKRQLV
jgi:hypothetical protein